MNLRVAEQMTGDAKYLDAAVAQLDHLFGRNFTVAPRSPAWARRRHYTRITARPWRTGMRGPACSWADRTPASWAPPRRRPGTTRARVLSETNEVAINWNAALAYGLAGFLPLIGTDGLR